MGDLFKMEWLGDFHSDWARLLAIVVVAVAGIVIGCAKPISQAWVADRDNARKHARMVAEALRKIDAAKAARKAGRLDLDR